MSQENTEQSDSLSYERCPRCRNRLRYLGQSAYICPKCRWKGVL